MLAAMGVLNTVADEVLARVFGAIEGIALGAMALGAGLAPVLVALLGVSGSLLATGVFLVVAGPSPGRDYADRRG